MDKNEKNSALEDNNGQLWQKILRVIWRVPVVWRLAINFGLAAASATAVTVWYWLLDAGKVGSEPRHKLLQIAVIVAPALVNGVVVTLFAWAVLRCGKCRSNRIH